MSDISLNSLLQLLESVTDDIRLDILNESSDDDNDDGPTLSNIIGAAIHEVDAIATDIEELSDLNVTTNADKDLVNKFYSSDMTKRNKKDGSEIKNPDTGIYETKKEMGYEGIKKPINADKYIEPNTAIFDYALAEIRKHSNNPDSYFSKSTIISGAIGAGAKQYIGSEGNDSMNLTDFKNELYKKVLSTTRVPINIAQTRVMIVTNYKKATLISKKIDNILIRQHISALTKYQTSLLKEFKKPIYKSKKFYKFIPDYMDVISDAIDNTHSMYNIVKGVFDVFATECRRLMNKTITESTESAYVKDIATFINKYTKPIRDIYNSQLNEDASVQSQELNNKSESLFELCNEFKDESNKSHLHREEQINLYRKQIGPLLNSFNFYSINPKFTYKAYTNINMMFDANELLEKLHSNIDFVTDVLKHYNNNSVQLNDFIGKVIPKNLQHCIPSSDANNFLGTILVNISPTICGQEIDISPDINTISENMINIPIALKAIDEHIVLLNTLIEKSFSTIIPSDRSDHTHSMVYNITNAFYAYLAIILSIYNSYDRLMQSSIDMVTAISKSIKDDI